MDSINSAAKHENEPTGRAQHLARLQKRRHTRRIFWSLLVLVLVTCTAVYVAGKLNQPIEGTIVMTKQPVAKQNTPALIDLNTTYFTTKYSGRYELLPPPKNSASLEATVLVAHQSSGIGTGSKLTLTVVPLPEGGVTEDSSYTLYSSRTDLYTLTSTQYGDDTVQVAIRHNPNYEKIILWPHGPYLLTVTLTAGAESDLINRELQTVLMNLKWVEV